MAKPSVPEFVADRNLLALKLSSSELSGLFKKKLVVPKDCAGLALFADGAVSLFSESQEVSGKFDLVLVKLGNVTFRMAIQDLRSGDGFPIQSTVGIAVSIQTERPDLFKDFTRTFFNFPGAYSAGDLRTAVLPELKKILSEFAASNRAEELHQRDRFREVESLLRSGLERALFGSGVRFERLFELHFAAAEFAERAAAEARKRDEDRRRVERAEHKEEHLRRLASFLSDTSVRELLAKMPDERLKGIFYAKLMEEDPSTLTPQEVADKLQECGDNVAALVYRAMEGFLGGKAPEYDPADFAPENAESLFAAVGHKILAIDLSKPEEKPREFEFQEALRSVRCVDTPDGPALLAGSKRSVQAVSLKDGSRVEYVLPGDRQPKGGINAVAAYGDFIFATHSEFGVARWDRRRPSEPGELLWKEVTSPHRTTRAAQIAGDRLLFATGDRVYSVRLGDGPANPVEYASNLDGPVTALAAGRAAIFAGTERGTIVSWKMDQPAGTVLVRRKEAIVNLRLARVCSIPHLFYSAKDLSVRARVIGQNLETSYDADGAGVGVLDAASDLVAASDTTGRRILLWKATSPARPAFDVDVAAYSDKSILDISMRKSKGRAG